MGGMRLRHVLFAAGLAVTSIAGPAAAPREAAASVSIAATFDGLLRESSSAVVLTPVEERSLWENGRIYTYTRVHVDRGVAGDLAAGRDVWVRTMGGIVGKVGQHVSGEPVFTVGRPALVFLHAGPPGAFEVTSRAQGQFPVVEGASDKTVSRVIRSGNVGALFAPRAIVRPGPLAPQAAAPVVPVLAADVLHGRTVDEASRDIAAAWKRAHETK